MKRYTIIEMYKNIDFKLYKSNKIEKIHKKVIDFIDTICYFKSTTK